MKTFSFMALPISLTIITCALLAPGDAEGLNMSRKFQTNAVAACQPALPAYEGVIRKRPLAVQNEGNTGAFVNCSFTLSEEDPTTILTYFNSVDGSPRHISCTGIIGTASAVADALYVTKEFTLAEGAFTWGPSDFGGVSKIPADGQFSLQCYLEPGMGLAQSVVYYFEDVGA